MKRRFFLAVLCLMMVVSIVAAPISASASVVRVMKVNVQGARLRSGPGVSTIQKPSLKKGSKVFYWGKNYKSFYYVRTTSGRAGYVYKKFLSSYGAVNSKQIYTIKSSTALYKKPKSGSKKVASLSKKQYVIVYETSGNWAYVKTLSGKGGYVKISKLKKA